MLLQCAMYTTMLVLKYVLQTGLPVCGISSLFGPLRLSSGNYFHIIYNIILLLFPPYHSAERKALLTVCYPWAVRAATSCKDLMSVRYEDRLNEKLIDIRSELNLEPAPDFN
jgi:hypothetical protein